MADVKRDHTASKYQISARISATDLRTLAWLTVWSDSEVSFGLSDLKFVAKVIDAVPTEVFNPHISFHPPIWFHVTAGGKRAVKLLKGSRTRR